MVNQGDGEGVYSGTRPNRSPKICQEIARNAPPQVIFFTKNETKPKNLYCGGVSPVGTFSAL